MSDNNKKDPDKSHDNTEEQNKDHNCTRNNPDTRDNSNDGNISNDISASVAQASPASSFSVESFSRLHTKLQNKKDIKSNFCALKRMVPCTRDANKVSHEEILHSAIDYIKYLQESLEARVRRNVGSSAGRAPLASISLFPQENVPDIHQDHLSESTQRSDVQPNLEDSSSLGRTTFSELISSINNPNQSQVVESPIRGKQKDVIVKNIIGKVNKFFIEQTSESESHQKSLEHPCSSSSNLITSPIKGEAFNVTPKDSPLTGYSNVGSTSSKRKLDSDSDNSIDSSNPNIEANFKRKNV